MCNLPVGIAASLKAMHDFNLDSDFGAARPASQPQGCYDLTDPVCSPLPKVMFGSCRQALNYIAAWVIFYAASGRVGDNMEQHPTVIV